MAKQTELPLYQLIEIRYEVLDPEQDSVRVGIIKCNRIGCGNVFKVDWDRWIEPWLSEIKRWEIVSRSCPYCFAAGRPPRNDIMAKH